MAITDNFNRANGGPGANWTVTLGAGCSIVSNALKGDQVGTQTGIHYSGASWNNDQSSQALNVNGLDYSGVAVRMSASGGGNWYAWFNTGSLQKCSGGSSVEIASISSHGAGDTIRISAIGTTIEVFKNEISQGSVVDATIASGEPGVVMQELTSVLDDWVGTGEVTGANDAKIVFRAS